MKKFRIAVGGLSHEANSFSGFLIPRTTFERVWERRGQALLVDAPAAGCECGGAISLFNRCEDVELIPLVDAAAGAGGKIEQAVYEAYRDELVNRIRAAMPVDAVFLALHGAGIAERENDIEGAILETVYDLVGPDVPIAVTLDLHGDITPKMVRYATFMVGYRHYPHDDIFDTGRRTAGLLMRTLRNEIHPVMHAIKIPVIAACQNQNTKTKGPLTDLHALARTREATGEVLAASYFTVQHGIDLPETSLCMVAVADDNRPGALKVAQEMAIYAWDNRHRFLVDYVTPRAAIEQGLATAGGPIVLSEASDCVGGGAYGDSSIVIKALYEHAPEASACILLTDPTTVKQASQVGAGGKFRARLGNSLSSCYGEPMDAEVKVEKFCDGIFHYRGGWLSEVDSSMGPSVHLRLGSIDILACSEPTYEYGAEQLLSAGIDPWEKKFVVVKNPMNFQQYYADAPLQIHLDTPGPTTGKIAEPMWQNLNRPVFPLDDNFTPEFKPL
jgi:microcystin degradation protein MlrC